MNDPKTLEDCIGILQNMSIKICENPSSWEREHMSQDINEIWNCLLNILDSIREINKFLRYP